MAVEDVSVPKRILNLDPNERRAKKEEDSADYWQNQAKTARAKREFIEETKFADNITNPPSQPEPPFQIKGSVNLGDINFQEQQRRAEEAGARARQEAQDRIDKAEKARDDVLQQLHATQLAQVQDQLTAKMERLQEAISNNNRGDIVAQLQSIEKLAGMLGYQKIEAGPTDSHLILEIKRLEHQMQREEREFQQLMKESDRNWELRLRELDQRAREADAKLAHEKEKWNALVSAPERLGAALAQGYLEKGIAGNANAPATANTIAPVANNGSGKALYHAEANEGETGELNCPECQTPIGISPVAKKVECVNCGTKVSIKRLPVSKTERDGNEFVGIT